MKAQPAARIEQMYWAAYARSPTDSERTACLEFLNAATWSDLAHALWNVKEFVYLY